MSASDGVFKNLGDSLQQEALGEMADSFFGARRFIEAELEQLHATLHELSAIADRALDRLCLLHALLLDEATARHFYHQLDIAPGNVLDLLQHRKPRLGFPLPGGLRWNSRFHRLFELAYTFAHDTCSTYLHGRQRTDPATGGIGLSLHYYQFKHWCESMNKRIENINRSQPPSVVLAYSRMLQGNSEQARAFGSTLGGIARLQDSNMGLPLLRCDAIGIGPLPALPSPVKAGEMLHSFPRKLYAERGPELRECMRTLENRRKEKLRQWNQRLN